MIANLPTSQMWKNNTLPLIGLNEYIVVITMLNHLMCKHIYPGLISCFFHQLQFKLHQKQYFPWQVLLINCCSYCTAQFIAWNTSVIRLPSGSRKKFFCFLNSELAHHVIVTLGDISTSSDIALYCFMDRKVWNSSGSFQYWNLIGILIKLFWITHIVE
jgi:hypothetical protein